MMHGSYKKNLFSFLILLFSILLIPLFLNIINPLFPSYKIYKGENCRAVYSNNTFNDGEWALTSPPQCKKNGPRTNRRITMRIYQDGNCHVKIGGETYRRNQKIELFDKGLHRCEIKGSILIDENDKGTADLD